MTRTVALVLYSAYCDTVLDGFKVPDHATLKLCKHEAGTRYNPNLPDARNRNNTAFRYTYP